MDNIRIIGIPQNEDGFHIEDIINGRISANLNSMLISTYGESDNALNKINTIIYPSGSGTKYTNIDYINDQSIRFKKQYFNEDIQNTYNSLQILKKDPVEVRRIKDVDNGLTYLIEKRQKSYIENASFRIYLHEQYTDITNKYFPESLNTNEYKFVINGEVKNGNMFVLSNNIFNDTYISGILLYISTVKSVEATVLKNRFITNYYTFFDKENNGYQIKEEYSDSSLANYLSTNINLINNDLIKNIIKQILDILSELSIPQHDFYHGNLTCNNVYVTFDELGNLFLKIGHFYDSAIFYNGIRFANKANSSLGLLDLTTINREEFVNFKFDYNSVIPVPGSVDIYCFILSLRSHPAINEKLTELTYLTEILDKMVDPTDINNIDSFINKNLTMINDLSKTKEKDCVSNDDEDFLKMYNILWYIGIDNFKRKYELDPKYYTTSKGYLMTTTNPTPLTTRLLKCHDADQRYKIFLEDYYKILLNNIRSLRINIDLNKIYFYTNNKYLPDIPDIINPYGHLPFLLGNSGMLLSYENKMCLTPCINNKCKTARYSKKTNSKLSDEISCNSYESIYNTQQYLALALILSASSGMMNKADEITIKKLICIIFDSKLLVPLAGCKYNIRGTLVNQSQESSILDDVNLGNMFDTFKLSPNADSINTLIEKIDTSGSTIKTGYYDAIVNILEKFISGVDMNAFLKINSSNSNQILIENEASVYKFTNKLILNCNTPHVATFLFDEECTSRQLIASLNLSSDLLPPSKYNIFFIEMIKNSLTLKNLMDNGIGFNDLVVIFFQIVYTLVCFGDALLVHNDLHMGNIFVEELDKPINTYYIIRDSDRYTTVKIKTNYFVRIFNFDKSYSFKENTNFENLSDIQIKNINYPHTNYSNDPSNAKKYDFTYLCVWLSYQVFNKDFKIGNNNDDFYKNILINKLKINIVVPDYLDKVDNYSDITNNTTANIKNMLSPKNWILENLPIIISENPSIGENIEVYQKLEDLENIKLSSNFNIFLEPNMNYAIPNLYINNNNYWKEMKSSEKLIVCHKFADVNDLDLIIKEFVIKDYSNINVTIDWIRHAESCANFGLQNVTDKPVESKKQYVESKTKTMINFVSNISSTVNKVKSATYFEPNLSFVGIQQAIQLGYNYVVEKDYDVILCSALTRTISTALLATRSKPNARIYVVPYLNEIQNFSSYLNLDYQNSAVGSSTLKKRIAFFKDWLDRNMVGVIDDVEINTDFTIIHNYAGRKGLKKIYLDSGTVTEKNFKPTVSSSGQNYQISDKILEETNKKYELIYSIIEDLSKMDILDDEIKKIVGKYRIYLDNINNIKVFRRGPVVDFSILEHFEKKYEYIYNSKDYSQSAKKMYNTREANKQLFYNEVIPYVKKHIMGNRDIFSIMCVSHGSYIRSVISSKDMDYYWKNSNDLKHMYNTQVTRELDNKFKVMYVPKLIRDEFGYLEIANQNICKSNSLKGILNYNLRETSNDILSQVYGYARNMVTSENVEYPTDDVKFYNDSTYNKNYNENELYGGYNKRLNNMSFR